MEIIKSRTDCQWQLQEAKAMFSDVVKAAFVKPQIITVRGKETAVIISYEQYKNLTNPRVSFFDFIQKSPLRDLKLELPERTAEPMRQVFL